MDIDEEEEELEEESEAEESGEDSDDDSDVMYRNGALSSEGEFKGVDVLFPRRSFRGARNVETVKDCELCEVRADTRQLPRRPQRQDLVGERRRQLVCVGQGDGAAGWHLVGRQRYCER